MINRRGLFVFSTVLIFFIALVSTSVAEAPNVSNDQDLKGSGFDVTTGELIELLSFQYSIRLDPDSKILSDWNSRLEMLTLRELERSENHYAYAVDPLRHRQIIAIRGTANLMNVLLDVEYWKQKSPELGIMLHHGFEAAASVVFNDVKQYLKRDLPIVVCGHSLGAAESIIVGMLLTKAGYDVEKIVASGPPKVTDAEGWLAFKTLPVVRVTAAFDPVPFLPPANFYKKAPFEQGGPLLMLLDGPYMTIAQPGFYDAMSAAFHEAKKVSEHFDVVDHRVWTYLARAEEKRQAVTFVPFQEWQAFAKPRDIKTTP